MSSFKLKLIAIITMLIDHIGAVLYPDIIILRIIGRIAFPIFAFLIVQGYIHTKDFNKYIGRMFLFALLSEIPYDLAFSNKFIEFGHQNIFFTLGIGLIAIKAFDYAKSNSKIIGIALIIMISLIAGMLNVDYGFFGVALIAGLYLFNGIFIMQSFIAMTILTSMPIYYYYTRGHNLYYLILICANISLLFIREYNNEKGFDNKVVKYGFYMFYPAHILILYIISIL